MTPFDFIKAVSKTKENLIVDSLTEKEYVPFVVNKGLSYFPDTVLYANEMNRLHLLDNKPQFFYLLNSIRARKRFSKWHKVTLDNEIKAISDYFKCNIQRAKEYHTLLSEDQIKDIKSKNTK